MIRLRRGRLPVLVCVLALFVAACGGDDDAGTDETPDATEATDATETADEGETTPDGDTEAPADDGTETSADAGGDGADLSALADAASADGSLTLYSVLDESVLQELGDRFTEEFGINVDFVRLVSSDLQQRFSAEADAGAPAADVIILSHSPFFADALDSGWLTPLADAGLPNFPGDLPEEYVVNDGGAAVVSVIPTSIVYNTDMVDAAPEDWTVYADEAYGDGLLQIATPDSSPISLAFWQLMRDEYGDEFLEDVAANNPVWHNSAVPATQAVAAGEGALGHPGVDAIVQNLQAEGAPVELAYPSVTTGPLTAVGLAEGSQNPDAAKLFAAWMLTEEATEFLADASGAGSPYGYNVTEGFQPPQVPSPDQAAELMEMLGAG